MTVGLEILNTSGLIQITSDTINYTFYGAWNFTSSDWSFGLSINVGSYDPGSILVATKCAGGVSHCGGSFNANHFGAGQNGLLAGGLTTNQSDSGTVYVFVEKQPPQGSGPGLEIYNADGSVIYSSSRKPLKIIGILTPPDFTYSAESGNIGLTVASGSYGSLSSNIAVIHMGATDKYRLGQDTDGRYSVTNWWRYSYNARVVGTDVYIQISRFINLSSPEAQGQGYPALIVDANGY
jgi:hypothetical protein